MKLKSFFSLVNRAWNDIVSPNRFGVSEDFLNAPKYPYGLDYSTVGMHDYYDMEFDEGGIILMSHYYDHLEKYGNNKKHYYSPVKIAHYALASYNDFLKTRNEKYEESFRTHLNYLTNNTVLCNGCIVWETPTSNPKYELEPGYISAIVQGLAISALVRGYIHFNDQRYIELAEEALDVLKVPVEEGGLLAKTKWGWVYEEYPCKPYSHVVNGFMFCLIGLYDLKHVNKQSEAKVLFEKGILSLEKMIPEWLDNDWATYDLRHITGEYKMNYATRHYQYLHIDQLNILYLITGSIQIFEAIEIIRSQISSITITIKLYYKKYRYLLSV
ncbi:MAG: D-glucuronyl C5-epimerase family protein [Candidatus Paceibacterota bacterium]